MATLRFITLGRLKSMLARQQKSMLFGAMLVEWECSKCNWLDFVDIENGTDYQQLEDAICNQHNTIKPQCEFEPNRIWLTFRAAQA